jgi:hypothetical protein
MERYELITIEEIKTQNWLKDFVIGAVDFLLELENLI